MLSLASLLSYFNSPSMSCTLRIINRHSAAFFKAAGSGKRSLGLRKGLVGGEENHSWHLWVEPGGRSRQFSDSILLLGSCRELVRWRLPSSISLTLPFSPNTLRKAIPSHLMILQALAGGWAAAGHFPLLSLHWDSTLSLISERHTDCERPFPPNGDS